jgi:hypothetical protein
VTAWLELGGNKVMALNVVVGGTYAESWKVCNNPGLQNAQWVILAGTTVSASQAGMSSPAGTYAVDLTQASTISLNVNAAATGTWKGLGWSIELAQ